MKLIDLLSVCNEAMTVTVYTENETIGIYNGRDSIPEEYNDRTVLNITATGDLQLDVRVDYGGHYYANEWL